MKLIHTADWHLGRLLHGVSLLDDQRVALGALCDLAQRERVDLVIVSGDLYDRAVPPPEAVSLLDQTVTRLVVDAGIPVVVIAGNHDSPERLDFGSRLLASKGLHIIGLLSPEPACVRLVLDGETVEVWAVPYVDPPQVAYELGDASLRGHEAALAALLGRIPQEMRLGVRSILVAHAFVAGGLACESERPLSVGGSGVVSAALFNGFDYVALGHLHRPQSVGPQTVRYAGSLLKYSFDEWQHEKSVSLVEIEPGGGATVEERRLPIRRDVRKLRGTLADLLASAPVRGREDYLWVDLLDESPVYNALERLRDVYPNVMWAARPATTMPQPGEAPRVEEVNRLGLAGLFRLFYREVSGGDIAEEQEVEFVAQAESFMRKRRGE